MSDPEVKLDPDLAELFNSRFATPASRIMYMQVQQIRNQDYIDRKLASILKHLEATRLEVTFEPIPKEPQR